jgi:hypothetical protein
MPQKQLKIILFGIVLILIAIFIQGIGNIIYGNELFIALIGVIISLIGLFTKD